MWMLIQNREKALNGKLTQPEEVDLVLKGVAESPPSKNAQNSDPKSSNNQTSGTYVSPYRAAHLKDSHF